MTRLKPIVAFGELMLRLDAPSRQRLRQAGTLQVTYTGGEANVAVALAQWGLPSRIVSKVPAHDVGAACLENIRKHGPNVDHVLRGGPRLGILFVESGAGQRGTQVVYDRLETSFRQAQPTEYNWNQILDGAGWFHFSGTAPAIGENVRAALKDGLKLARAKGIPISFDCSYRSTLWPPAEAAQVLPEFLSLSDVFIGSPSDAHGFFGITSTGGDCVKDLQQRYQLDCVAFTGRQVASAATNNYSAIVRRGDETVTSRDYAITDIVDRIGAGDAFTAGLIRGFLRDDSLSDTVEFATAAAVLKHSIPGDFLLAQESEIESLLSGQSQGQVRR